MELLIKKISDKKNHQVPVYLKHALILWIFLIYIDRFKIFFNFFK